MMYSYAPPFDYKYSNVKLQITLERGKILVKSKNSAVHNLYMFQIAAGQWTVHAGYTTKIRPFSSGPGPNYEIFACSHSKNTRENADIKYTCRRNSNYSKGNFFDGKNS